MKKLLVLIFLILNMGLVQAQEKDNSATIQEIDTQVWEAFKKAYAEQDGKLFNSIHSDNVIRITSRGILRGSEYKERNTANFARTDRPKVLIDFVFESRIHESDIAYEVGYYKVTYFEKEGESHSYGRFHVVLKKIEGTWKITQDWDAPSINGVRVTEADFEKLRKDQ